VDDLWRVRIGDYGVIYTINDGKLLVYLSSESGTAGTFTNEVQRRLVFRKTFTKLLSAWAVILL